MLSRIMQTSSASTFIYSMLFRLSLLSSIITGITCAKAVTNITHAFMRHEFHYLNVPKLGMLTVNDSLDCTFECLRRRPLCAALNLAASAGVVGKLWCETLSSDKYRDNLEFRRNVSSHHFSITSPCSSFPCQNGGTCLANYKDDKYECVCEKEFIGEHCETAAKSCKELYDTYKYNTSQPLTLLLDSLPTSVYCHMGNFGCGDGVWTTIMKTDGNKNTFHFNALYWVDTNSYNIPGGMTGFDSQETKLPTYWSTPFSKICLAMKIGQQINFIVVNTQANSLYSLIADGNYRATSLGRNTWKTLIGPQASLQPHCNKEGFNAIGCCHQAQARVRIGIVSNEQNNCASCDSRLGFGAGGSPDDAITCGNAASSYPDNGDKFIKTMGYILVQ